MIVTTGTTPDPAKDPLTEEWRSEGRTIYAVSGELVTRVRNRKIAQQIVAEHNANLLHK